MERKIPIKATNKSTSSKTIAKDTKNDPSPNTNGVRAKSVWRLKSLSSASAEAIPKTTAENISKIIEIVKGIAMS